MVWEVWEVLLLWYTGVVLMGLSTSHLQHTPSSPLIHLYDVFNCAQLITSRDGAREKRPWAMTLKPIPPSYRIPRPATHLACLAS